MEEDPRRDLLPPPVNSLLPFGGRQITRPASRVGRAAVWVLLVVVVVAVLVPLWTVVRGG